MSNGKSPMKANIKMKKYSSIEKGRHLILVLVVTIVVAMIESSIFELKGTATDVGIGGAFLILFLLNFLYCSIITFFSFVFMMYSKKYNFTIVLLSASIIVYLGKVVLKT